MSMARPRKLQYKLLLLLVGAAGYEEWTVLGTLIAEGF